ncbi:hypothetical protein [Streptomyces sp. NBC_00038]|uniref:hypothetical protein n=1 Tax=Streptomyces sp. NBC_00038 TaxID=2903615 RepID=UPI00225AE4FE|nr:hypothetical protein [Streptomyces sp. NBC_00038]MCX5562065.1 hypothetical protein [Streptomyces sp. NBC_00038]
MTVTTALQLRPRTTVRAAGLVDVPAVVRLIAPSPPPPPLSGPGPDLECSALDWEQTQSAMRLVLAHHTLEEGQVWVAEREDGTLLAAAIWLPPGTGSEPPDTRFSSLFSRELAIGPQERPVLPTELKEAWPDVPHWKVVVVGALDDTSAWDHTVAADLLAPGLRTVDAQDAIAVAVMISARHGDQLRPLGFRRPREVHPRPGASAWLTTRHPTVLAGG